MAIQDADNSSNSMMSASSIQQPQQQLVAQGPVIQPKDELVDVIRGLRLEKIQHRESSDALFEALGGSGPAVAAACQLVSQQRGEGFSLPALFEGIGRWALAALGPDAPPAEQPWVPGSGPQARAFSAAECRGVLANILLLNV